MLYTITTTTGSRAFVTLDDAAREYAREALIRAGGADAATAEQCDDIFAHDGSGQGTIGPLPDDTMIEVKQVGLTTLRTLANYPPFEPDNIDRIVAAYNEVHNA